MEDTVEVDRKQYLISETKSPGAVLRSYATLLITNDKTVGLQFSTTFSLAKKPDEHRVAYTMFFQTDEDAGRFLDFLVESM